MQTLLQDTGMAGRKRENMSAAVDRKLHSE